jgi:hypothetical protein
LKRFPASRRDLSEAALRVLADWAATARPHPHLDGALEESEAATQIPEATNIVET